MAKDFKIFDDSELSVVKPVFAKYTHKASGVKYTWKKSACMFYPENSKKNFYANQGLTLAYQRVIRQQGLQAEGLSTITSNGVAIDYSDIKEV